MKKMHWRKTKETIFGFKCLKHIFTNELCLFSKKGEIWQVNENTCRAIIYNSRIVRKFLPKSKWNVDKHDEILITFSCEELGVWIKRLAVSDKLFVQLRIANRSRILKNLTDKNVQVNLPLAS